MNRDEQIKVFKEKLLPQYVDLLMLADDMVAEYAKRKGDGEGGAGFTEDLDIRERLMFAHAMIVMGVTTRIERVGQPPPPAQVEGPPREQAPAGDPDNPPPMPFPVRVDPDKAQAAFSLVLAKRRIALPAAQAVIDALTNTPEGNEMLRLCLYNAVMRNRPQEGN